MIVNNMFLLNSNLYKSMSIKEYKNGFIVNIKDNIFGRDNDTFDKIKKVFFDKPINNILEGIDDKDSTQQLDTLVSYFARNNSITSIIFDDEYSIKGDSQSLSLKLKNSYDEVLKKIARKYNEDRIRFYGKNSKVNQYVLNVSYNETGYEKEEDKITFDLKDDDNDKYVKGIHLIPIDEKFLQIFLREQVINRDGDIILEKSGNRFLLTIGNMMFNYDELLNEAFRIALIKRDNRIEEEKCLQFKLDI